MRNTGTRFVAFLMIAASMIAAPPCNAATTTRPTTPSDAALAEAAKRLGDEEFKVRAEAARMLWSAGEAALPALSIAAASDDPEVSGRAKEVMGKIHDGVFPDSPRTVEELLQSPDFPEAVKDIVRQYRDMGAGKWPHRQADVAGRLLRMGDPGLDAYLELWHLVPEPFHRSLVHEQLRSNWSAVGPSLAAAGRYERLDKVLGVASRNPNYSGHYAVFHLLRGSLPTKVRRLAAVRNPDKATLRLLLHCYLADGRLPDARRVAEQMNDKWHKQGLYVRLGDWKLLAGLQSQWTEDFGDRRIRSLGMLAASHRLAGNQNLFVDTLDRIIAYGNRQGEKPKPAQPGMLQRSFKTTREIAEPLSFACIGSALLILNDRPEQGADMLTRHRIYLEAFDALCARMRFTEALQLTEQAQKAKVRHVGWLELRSARVLDRLGERDKADALLRRLTSSTVNGELLAAAFRIHSDAGRKEQAIASLSRALTFGGRIGQGEEHRLTLAYPGQGRTATAWWHYLRGKHPDLKVAVVVRKLDDVLTLKTGAAEIAVMAEEAAEEVMGKRPAVDQWQRLLGLANTCEAAGHVDQAMRYLRRSAKELASLRDGGEGWIRGGDRLVKHKRWAEAAEAYRTALKQVPSSALACYLTGWAMCQAGKPKEGAELLSRAQLIPLGNGLARFRLVEALHARGLTEHALSELRLLERFAHGLWGDLLQPYKGFPRYASTVHLTSRLLAPTMMASGQHARAAECYERSRLALLNLSLVDSIWSTRATGFHGRPSKVVPMGELLLMSWRVHHARALACLKGDRLDKAVSEAKLCLDLLPGRTEAVVAVVGALDRAGRKAEADKLFERAARVLAEVCRDFPRSAEHRRELERLASACRRKPPVLQSPAPAASGR